MKRTDYFRLAKWLLQRESNRLLRGFGAGLCMDSVLPDGNPLTSLRGIRGRQGLHGHNAEITGKRICRLVISLTKAKKAGVLCGLRRGTALHYLADAFTYPHHACFTGSLSDYIAYEASLHRTFISYLTDGCHPWPWAHIPDFGTYFADMLRLYARARKSEQTDCRFITLMCSMVFESVLHPVQKEKEGPLENPDYNRFIPAGRQRSRDLSAFAGSRIGGARP